METLARKRQLLETQLRSNAPLLVAYSGGVDSAFLLAEARRVLGRENLLGVIADSASLPRKALAAALELARIIDAPVEVVSTGELANPDYASNPPNRCYFCKAELFLRLERIARERGFRGLAYGENADDMRQIRPGRKAAEEFSILAPLRDAGFSKSEIREASGELGLPTADAPAQPCLSSRIPHGVPVTERALAMVESAEDWVRSLGFRVFRVRHLPCPDSSGFLAKLQVAPEEMDKIEGLKVRIEGGVLAVGYSGLEIDPLGYRAPVGA